MSDKEWPNDDTVVEYGVNLPMDFSPTDEAWRKAMAGLLNKPHEIAIGELIKSEEDLDAERCRGQ